MNNCCWRLFRLRYGLYCNNFWLTFDHAIPSSSFLKTLFLRFFVLLFRCLRGDTWNIFCLFFLGRLSRLDNALLGNWDCSDALIAPSWHSMLRILNIFSTMLGWAILDRIRLIVFLDPQTLSLWSYSYSLCELFLSSRPHRGPRIGCDLFLGWFLLLGIIGLLFGFYLLVLFYWNYFVIAHRFLVLRLLFNFRWGWPSLWISLSG